jgi:hypothetical protein
MAVDDKQVQALIDKVIARNKEKGRSIIWDLLDALSDIIAERRGICENYEYAAADHYLMARVFVALTGHLGAMMMIPIIMAYDFAKVMDLGMKELTGRKLMPSTDSDPCPPTGPSIGVMRWALKGVAHGLGDYEIRVPSGTITISY